LRSKDEGELNGSTALVRIRFTVQPAPKTSLNHQRFRVQPHLQIMHLTETALTVSPLISAGRFQHCGREEGQRQGAIS